ncbi:MAG: energy transducer TonB [Terriglobales bacterium]
MIWLCVLLCGSATFANDGPKVSSTPDQFLIARHTFIDVGPPNDFYEIISVHGTSAGTTVEKVTLTPSGDGCIQPPKIEMEASAISDPVRVVLEGRDPCAIPERALRRELKRRKQGLVFSGAEISMHVQCGGKERTIRADVLDRDIFDPNAGTPENTSWTMRLLARLDKAFPSGVLDRPTFASSTEPAGTAALDGNVARALASEEYDDLFVGAPDRPSDLYRASQIQPPLSEVLLRSSEPFQPENFIRPGYPPIARLARIEGAVVVTFQVDANGGVTDTQFESGHPMLRAAVEKAVSEWKFPKEAANHRIKATIDFRTNCPPKTK